MADISQLTQVILGLPLDERIHLAQELWASLQPRADGDLANDINEALDEADRRDAQFDNGAVTGLSHDEVMAIARKSLQCR